MSADYRTEFIKDAKQQRLEREWLADHLDHEIGMPPELYKRRNPAIKAYNYALNMTIFQKGDEIPQISLTVAYSADMRRWFRGHPEYNMEDAFLHDDKLCPAPQPVTAGCRLVVEWSSAKRWVPNPADPGRVTYEKDRFKRLAAGGWDGIFLDEHASGSMDDYVCGPTHHTREYHGTKKACDGYFDAMVNLMAAERAAAGKMLIVNLSQYSTSYDFRMAVAGGGAQLEGANYPAIETEPRWNFIDKLLASGIFVNYAPASPDVFPQGYTQGNSVTLSQRFQLAMLANYYLVVPDPPDNLTFTNQHGWNAPFLTWWTAAQEIDLGKPLGLRHVYQSGKDGAGQGFKIYVREFQNAFVIAHPKLEWSDKEFGDKSAVDVTIPGGQPLVPLSADGTHGSPVTRVALRNAESVILLKP